MKRTLFLSLLLLTFSLNSFAAGGGGTAAPSPYFSFKKPFVVNVMDDGKMRFLQIAIQMKLVDPATATEVTHHSDAIRHNVIMLLSSQETRGLYSTTGKERLRSQTLEEIRSALKGRTKNVKIEDIFFTSFIIQ